MRLGKDQLGSISYEAGMNILATNLVYFAAFACPVRCIRIPLSFTEFYRVRSDVVARRS